jgi:mannose-1-phosphate guanylyltransferase
VLAQDEYAALPAISIDYAVLEKDDDVAVLEADFEWDDVGSFAALERVLDGDDRGNRAIGAATLADASGNVVVTDDRHLVALFGVDDLVVVHTADATLVCRKEDAERLKGLVEKLKEEGRDSVL